MPTQLKPPIFQAGLRQIGILAKLRNECNTTTKLYPEIANDSDINPLHINLKINQIFQTTTPLKTRESHHQCSKAIGNIIRKASHALSTRFRDKEHYSYDQSPEHYHNNLKINSGIIPGARDQPKVTALTISTTNKLQRSPQEVISIVTSR